MPSGASMFPIAIRVPRDTLTDVYAGSGKPQYGSTWMRATVKARQDADRAKTGPREELKIYLNSPLENVENVIAWWGVGFENVLLLLMSNLAPSTMHRSTPHCRGWHGTILLSKDQLFLRNALFLVEA
jgi:hypothetical protein